MKNSSCQVFIFEVDDFRPSAIANCAFNSFLCYNVFMLNIVTIHAIRRSSSLPKTLKTLLVSLAVSDVGIGLSAQPLYILLLVNELQEETSSCISYLVLEMITGLFPVSLFLGVVAVSVDRFLAIQFHLRYQELVTHRLAVAVVILIWMISVSFSLITLWVPHDIKFIIFCIGGVVGLLLTTMAYLKIYLAVRRHKNQIQACKYNK